MLKDTCVVTKGNGPIRRSKATSPDVYFDKDAPCVNLPVILLMCILNQVTISSVPELVEM